MTREQANAFLREALAYEREAFEEDTDVEGADLCEWFSDWRKRVADALTVGPGWEGA